MDQIRTFRTMALATDRMVGLREERLCIDLERNGEMEA